MTHCFKREWEQTTGDELTDSWGASTYYFETDSDLNIIRQVQVFQNGQVLKYHQEFTEDEFGMLSDQQVDEDEFKEFFIDCNEFAKIWSGLERKTI